MNKLLLSKWATLCLAFILILILAMYGPKGIIGEDAFLNFSTSRVSSSQITVNILVECLQAEKCTVSSYANLLDAKVTVQKGDTVYKALMIAAQEAGLAVVESGGYIQSIAELSAGDFGVMSGWIYTVNGETAMLGCNHYVLSDGDCIQWSYVVDET